VHSAVSSSFFVISDPSFLLGAGVIYITVILSGALEKILQNDGRI